MISNEKLSILLRNNGIEEDMLEEKVYNTLITGIFEVICKDILKRNAKISEKERFRKSPNKILAAKRLVDTHIGCTLSQDEYEILAGLLKAFFCKDSRRKKYDNDYKKKLLKSQDNRCAICNAKIEYADSHHDHIIPWNYVGDCLSNNYQMLCETCNKRKATSAYSELSMLLLNKK